MKSLRALLALALLLVAAFAAPIAAPAAAQRANGRGADPLEGVRQRWEALTPAERERMQERWKRFQALPEDERREMAERAQRVKSLRERVERQVPAPVMERVRQLPASKREELLREMVDNETARIGAHMRSLLPAEVVQRLEQARPEDRARYFTKFQRQQRERVTRYMLERLGARLALPKDAVDALKAQPEEQRAAKVLELRQQLTREEARTLGIPPGLTEQQWNEWLGLPPEEFFGRLAEHVRQRQLAGLEAGIARGGARAVLAPRLALERIRALRKLQEVQRVDPAELVELAELAPAERRERVEARVRERCLRWLGESSLVSSEELARWSTLAPAELSGKLKELVAELHPRSGATPAHAEGTTPATAPADGAPVTPAGETPRR